MPEIDIVITWVDGADPAIQEKRDHFLSNAPAPLHDNGTNPHRWVCSDELRYCLRSIANNAPWVRRVWIVTDDQIPDLKDVPSGLAQKISIIDHRIIFAGYESALPTFNSLSIETMLWRIPELAEHFLYFNDDVFLTAPVEPSDFFGSNCPVLRGKWVDYSHLPACEESRDEAALLNHYNQIKSAEMMGYGAHHIFASAHVVHPILRSVMASLFESHHRAFAANCAYRFRSTDQFLPQSLHNHHCIAADQAIVLSARDYLHIGVGALSAWTAEEIEAYLASEARRGIKFLCVNDLPEVERSYPQTRKWIDAVIAG